MEQRLRAILGRNGFRPTKARSRMMSAVRGQGNLSTEQRFRFALVRAGVNGWQLHPKLVAGRPDFYFESGRIAVFVDGCFWHGCSHCGHVPHKNRPFWMAKLTRNRERDRAAERVLRAESVRVVRFWEHELAESLPGCVRRLQELLACGNSIVQNARNLRRPPSLRRTDAP